MTRAELRVRLSARPRLHYGQYPTPLEPLNNLTKELNGPQIWIKRDDTLGPGMGGNKARKLEFLMADVLARRKEKVVTYGGLQSNHARMTAAACASQGIEAHIFCFERRPKLMEGNLLLDQLFGAQLHFITLGTGTDASLTIEMSNRLVRFLSLLLVGPGAYFMPVGGHTTTGCLGYVLAAYEIQEQIVSLGLADKRTTVITAAGTGGTLAGLLAGFTLFDSPFKVIGIDVGSLWRAFPTSIARLAGNICFALGARHNFRAEDVPIIENRYVGSGYARITEEAKIAIQTLAQLEGIMLDPVYTGKAFAALLDLVRGGHFSAEEQVVFLHTGGLPGLWAYIDELSEQ